MDFTTLAAFRQHLYRTGFTQARDALFDLADALLSDTHARSFAELSLAACFQRKWPSLYEALEDGRIDRSALQRLFAASLPPALVGSRLVLGQDVSSILRPDATTSNDRTFVHRSSGSDAKGKPLRVSCWHGLHLKQARHIVLSVRRVVRDAATGSKRDPRVSWFWWRGGPVPPLAEVPGLYGLRFGEEHSFRFDKQDLLWASPRPRSPEQFERWTDLVSIVHNQLVLMQPLVEGQRRPWERQTGSPTLGQVRRGAGKLLAQLGTPARAPQPRGKAAGRAKGATVRRAPRHPVIRKSAKPPVTRKKTTVKRVGQRQ